MTSTQIFRIGLVVGYILCAQLSFSLGSVLLHNIVKRDLSFQSQAAKNLTETLDSVDESPSYTAMNPTDSEDVRENAATEQTDSIHESSDSDGEVSGRVRRHYVPNIGRFRWPGMGARFNYPGYWGDRFNGDYFRDACFNGWYRGPRARPESCRLFADVFNGYTTLGMSTRTISIIRPHDWTCGYHALHVLVLV